VLGRQAAEESSGDGTSDHGGDEAEAGWAPCGLAAWRLWTPVRARRRVAESAAGMVAMLVDTGVNDRELPGNRRR
jgi:hypothetical protein